MTHLYDDDFPKRPQSSIEDQFMDKQEPKPKSRIIQYGLPTVLGALGVIITYILLHLYQDHIGFHQLVNLEIQRQNAAQSKSVEKSGNEK